MPLKQPLHAPPIPQKALTLSQEVDECKPLSYGKTTYYKALITSNMTK